MRERVKISIADNLILEVYPISVLLNAKGAVGYYALKS